MGIAVVLLLSGCSDPSGGAGPWSPRGGEDADTSVGDADVAREADSGPGADADVAATDVWGPLPPCEDLVEEFKAFVERNDSCSHEYDCRIAIGSAGCRHDKGLPNAAVGSGRAVRRAEAYREKYWDCPNAKLKRREGIHRVPCVDNECFVDDGYRQCWADAGMSD